MLRQRYFIEGFRLTRDAHGLTIKTTDYHAEPLFLGRADLADLGLRLIDHAEIHAEVKSDVAESSEPEP